jgi:cyclopropane-fatty-acyl-phospholipid synthase
MKQFWNNFGDKLFSKITEGDLTVHYTDGTTKHYGQTTSPKVTLELKNSNLFKNVALYGDIGFAESYMDGDFECDNLTAFILMALQNSKALETKSEDSKLFSLNNLLPWFNRAKHLLRRNSKSNSKKNIQEHYDLSNEFFKLMLDDTMMYSSAVFESANTSLYHAQCQKIDRLAQKLNLKPGDEVLEIGSGWGEVSLHLTKKYGCKVKTLTLSEEQKKLCEDKFSANDINDSVEVLLKDYRDMEGKFDAIISVEMFEAVGEQYFDVFFKKCESLLKPSGVLVMQIITIPAQRYESYSKGTDFIRKYIFPGGHLPSISKILAVNERHTDLNIHHLEDFTEHYAKTLNLWRESFEANLEKTRELGFDERFIRMWRIYLQFCEAAFLARTINLTQIVLTRYENMALNEGLLECA